MPRFVDAQRGYGPLQSAHALFSGSCLIVAYHIRVEGLVNFGLNHAHGRSWMGKVDTWNYNEADLHHALENSLMLGIKLRVLSLCHDDVFLTGGNVLRRMAAKLVIKIDANEMTAAIRLAVVYGLLTAGDEGGVEDRTKWAWWSIALETSLKVI